MVEFLSTYRECQNNNVWDADERGFARIKLISAQIRVPYPCFLGFDRVQKAFKLIVFDIDDMAFGWIGATFDIATVLLEGFRGAVEHPGVGDGVARVVTHVGAEEVAGKEKLAVTIGATPHRKG